MQKGFLVKKYSFYDALIAKSTLKPNDLDGSTALRAIPAKPSVWFDPEKNCYIQLGLIESLGIVPWDTSEQYLRLMDMYAEGKMDWDLYFRLRQDFGKTAYARDVAHRMQWKLSSAQLQYLAERGV